MRKTTNKLLAVLLATSLAIGGAGGIAPETHAEAAGTDLLIHSVEELNAFAKSRDDYAGKVVRLANDIQYDAANEFLPISSNTLDGFAGTFDGCGYTISGIQSSIEDKEGLFYGIAKGGIVKNVTVKDSCFDADYYSMKNGAIACYNYGTIDNCHNRGTTARSGIAGTNHGEIKNCTSTGTIYGECDYVGGIVGLNTGNIFNSCNLGSVRLGESGNRVGGIVGYISEGKVVNCYNAGEVTADYSNSVGGIIGYYESGTLSRNYCSEESADQCVGDGILSEDQGKAMPVADMQTDSFITELNKSCSNHSDWLQWEIRPQEGNGFPLPKLRVSLKTCEFQPIASQVYDGKEKRPAVTVTYQGVELKNGMDYQVIYHNNVQVGDASVEIEGLNSYMDSVTLSFAIVQGKKSDNQKTSLAKQSVKVKTLKKRKIKVSWKKDSAANGYQIQYSTSSGFSKGVKTKTVNNRNTTSITLSKLKKGKKYYVRVRSYKTVSGSTQKTYGTWSSAKKSKKIR